VQRRRDKATAVKTDAQAAQETRLRTRCFGDR
jgi:hypothetical protein